jgi:hypothetical protein
MKEKLTKAVGVIGVGALMFGSAALIASAAPNQQSCFGQDRAAGVQAISGKVWGDIASDRAGDNAAQNAAYRDACQAA